MKKWATPIKINTLESRKFLGRWASFSLMSHEINLCRSWQLCPWKEPETHRLEGEPGAGTCPHDAGSPKYREMAENPSNLTGQSPPKTTVWGGCWRECGISQQRCANASFNCRVYFHMSCSLLTNFKQTSYSLIMLSLHFKEGGTERENAAWKQMEKSMTRLQIKTGAGLPYALKFGSWSKGQAKQKDAVFASWFYVGKIVNTWQPSNEIGSNCGATIYITRGKDAHFGDGDFGGCAVLTEFVGKCTLICKMSCKHE